MDETDGKKEIRERKVSETDQEDLNQFMYCRSGDFLTEMLLPKRITGSALDSWKVR